MVNSASSSRVPTILLLCAILAFSSLYASRFWPLETDGKANGSENDGMCEACQSVVELITKQMASEANAAMVKKGLTDVAAMELLKSDKFCTFGNFLYFAEKSKSLPVYTLTAQCDKILTDKEETLEKVVPKYYNDKEKLATELCIPDYCTSLWTESDRPENRESKSARNIRMAEEFLEWNGKQKHVVTVKPGLQYKKLSKSSDSKGVHPSASDVVKVHYKGLTLDGKEFDSSYKRGQPTEFPLRGVISGWTDGIQLMTPGDRFRFFIHPDHAYGLRGAGNVIGPNECLVFDVELLQIVGKGSQEL